MAKVLRLLISFLLLIWSRKIEGAKVGKTLLDKNEELKTVNLTQFIIFTLMENYIYTKQSGRFALPQFQMLGVVLIIWGAYLAWQLNPLSILTLVGGASLATAAAGVQINLKEKLHREYIAIFGYKFGEWKELPPIEYVTVFIEHYAQEKAVASIGGEDKFHKIKISLIVSKTHRFDAGLFENKEIALKNAMNIARSFNTKLLDYTEREPKWVDL